MSHNDSTKNLVLGALLGSLVVGTSAAFLSSKMGQGLREDAADKIEDLKDKLSELYENASDKTECVKNEIGEKACEYTKKIRDFVSEFGEELGLIGRHNKEKIPPLLIGSILGGILAIGASAYFLNGKDKRGYFEKFGGNFSSLKDTVLEALTKPENRHSNSKNYKIDSSDDILELIGSGLDFWKRLKRKIK